MLCLGKKLTVTVLRGLFVPKKPFSLKSLIPTKFYIYFNGIYVILKSGHDNQTQQNLFNLNPKCTCSSIFDSLPEATCILELLKGLDDRKGDLARYWYNYNG